MPNSRTELQREIIEALVSTKAINFEAVGGVLAKYGARAALAGDAFAFIINWRVIHGCIPPFLERTVVELNPQPLPPERGE